MRLRHQRGRFECLLWEESPHGSSSSAENKTTDVPEQEAHTSGVVTEVKENLGQSRQYEMFPCSAANRVPLNQHVSSNGFFSVNVSAEV